MRYTTEYSNSRIMQYGERPVDFEAGFYACCIIYIPVQALHPFELNNTVIDTD